MKKTITVKITKEDIDDFNDNGIEEKDVEITVDEDDFDIEDFESTDILMAATNILDNSTHEEYIEFLEGCNHSSCMADIFNDNSMVAQMKYECFLENYERKSLEDIEKFFKS